jgi:hypothetical protein
MTALEQLPARMDRVEPALTALSACIDDARREARVLHENAIGRIAMIGEGLDALSQKVDRLDTTLSQRIDGADAKLDLILARLDSPRKKKSR